ncbi:MAG: GGDEF domain-containing protein [Planctomycetota bacterium]
MWLDIAIALSCAGCGVTCGWVMHAIGGLNPAISTGEADGMLPSRSEFIEANEESEMLSRVAGHLKEHASKMSSDVDAHQNHVESIAGAVTDSDLQSPEAFSRVVRQILEANDAMRQKLEVAQDQIHNQTLELDAAKRRAETDALTKIPNRAAFDKHIGQRHAMGPELSPNSPHAGCLALLDVDHFKKFNDTYGHLAGDEVLKVVASVLHQKLNNYGLVARYGGEEFALILDGVSASQAAILADDVRAAVARRKIVFEQQTLSVTVSMGVAQLMPGETIEQWIERSDLALYASKEAGRNCGHWMDGNDPVKIEAKADRKPASVNKHAASGTNRDDANDDAASSADHTVSLGDHVGSEIRRDALAYLPDSNAISETFKDMRERAGEDVELTLMALRIHDESLGEQMESVLAMIRSNLRSVDRMGCHDDDTLLVCMPSMDGDAASRQGAKMVTAVAQLVGGDQTKVSLGVAQVDRDESFESLLDSVLQQVSTV